MTDEAMSPLRRRMIEDMTVRSSSRRPRRITFVRQDSPPFSADRRGRPRPRICAYQLHLSEPASAAEHQWCRFQRYGLLLRHGRPADVTSRRPSSPSRGRFRRLEPRGGGAFLEAAPGPEVQGGARRCLWRRSARFRGRRTRRYRMSTTAYAAAYRAGQGRKDRNAMSRRSCSSCCATGGVSRGRGSGCFPDRTGSTISPRANSTAPFMLPLRRPRSPSG